MTTYTDDDTQALGLLSLGYSRAEAAAMWLPLDITPAQFNRKVAAARRRSGAETVEQMMYAFGRQRHLDAAFDEVEIQRGGNPLTPAIPGD